MSKITMLTIVPIEMAKELQKSKMVKDYNPLPNINRHILESVRTAMQARVGYSYLPIACLTQPAIKPGCSEPISVNSFMNYMPINAKSNVIFQLEMPEDLVISIDYKELLVASEEVDHSESEDELQFVLECFSEKLDLGIRDTPERQISFIPFLDYNRCAFYAKFNDKFETEELDLPGLGQIKIREMASFIE